MLKRTDTISYILPVVKRQQTLIIDRELLTANDSAYSKKRMKMIYIIFHLKSDGFWISFLVISRTPEALFFCHIM